MHKILEKVKEEFFAILPPTIFFFVALHIVAFIRVLMTKGSHFEPMSTTSIAIGSLILGMAGQPAFVTETAGPNHIEVDQFDGFGPCSL